MALVTGYLYRNDMRAVGERLLAGLMPGRAVTVTTADGAKEVVLHKSLGGHFETSVEIGPVSVPVLIDTGASSVALRFEDAVRIGIDPSGLAFTRTVLTANGQAQAAPLLLPNCGSAPSSGKTCGGGAGRRKARPEPARHELPVDARLAADADRRTAAA